MKLLVVGDLHFKSVMGYADYVKDGRAKEKQQVLDFIVKSAEDCDGVVLLGDNLNNRNNPSEVVRDFVSFVERFRDKQVYIISGNHESTGDGKTAIDFMMEIDKPNWHIFPGTGIGKVGDLVFLPYLYSAVINKLPNPNKRLSQGEIIFDNLPKGRFLFCHHTISDMTYNGISTNTLTEVLLPYNDINNAFIKTFTGHIHTRSIKDNINVVGSVFTHNSGDADKYLCKLDDNDSTIVLDWIKLPGRQITTLLNPEIGAIKALQKDSIAKVIFTDRELSKTVAAIREALVARKINFKIIEQYREERRKATEAINIIDLDIEKLLKLYAKQKNINAKALMEGFDIIK